MPDCSPQSCNVACQNQLATPALNMPARADLACLSKKWAPAKQYTWPHLIGVADTVLLVAAISNCSIGPAIHDGLPGLWQEASSAMLMRKRPKNSSAMSISLLDQRGRQCLDKTRQTKEKGICCASLIVRLRVITKLQAKQMLKYCRSSYYAHTC